MVSPLCGGTPGLLTSQRPYIYASPRSRHPLKSIVGLTFSGKCGIL
nr:MAG TPA: hypothetical protein [Bacteriophage sp.]